MKTTKNQNLQKFAMTLVVIIAINLLGHFVFKRFDLTRDQRYTLSETSVDIINRVAEPLVIDVFLEGQFPPEFRRLQLETKQLLEEFSAYNANIKFNFVNPMENEEESVENMRMLYSKGLTPINITVDDKGKQSQEVVFPWAIANYGEKSAKIQLLKNMMGASTQEKVVSSVQHLEYAVAEAIQKLTTEKTKKIAVIKGVGQLHDLQIADLLMAVRESYFTAAFTLDSVAANPVKTSADLKGYDLAIIAKPTQAFSEEEKLVLDQFVVNGGKTLWLIDQVKAEMDSLYNETGSIMSYPMDLKLNDMFFKYGIRINPMLIKDEQGTTIKLAIGERGSETQYEDFIWKFAPFSYTKGDHPIIKNIEGVRFEFANPIEILKNKIKKTILLSSSPYSRAIGTPFEVSLDLVNEEMQDPKSYTNGNIPMAVLLEGNFESVYKNRVLPFKDSTFVADGKLTKMIVISDGDVIKNQIDQYHAPLELGYDRWTNNLYGNKELMLNSINYLLDDTGLINIRSKDVTLPLLDKERVYMDYNFIQIITVGMPLVILGLFGLIFTFLRKRKYAK